MGRFKFEMGERYHMKPVDYNTDSGIEVRKLILLLMVALGGKVINNWYIFQDEEVNPVPIVALDVIFHEVFEEVRNVEKKLIGKDVVIEE